MSIFLSLTSRVIKHTRKQQRSFKASHVKILFLGMYSTVTQTSCRNVLLPIENTVMTHLNTSHRRPTCSQKWLEVLARQWSLRSPSCQTFACNLHLCFESHPKVTPEHQQDGKQHVSVIRLQFSFIHNRAGSICAIDTEKERNTHFKSSLNKYTWM